MIASFHCIEYRRPVLRPPRRVSDTTPGCRFWRPLNIGGDFAWFRQHPTRRALYPRLRPDLRRWAFYAVWADDTVLEQFLERSPIGLAWQDDTRQSWHVWLRPRRVHGPWPGFQLLTPAVTDPGAGGPVAELVRLDLSLRGTLTMWGSAAPHVLAHLPGDDDLLLGLPLVDRPYTQPVSFSLWRSAERASAFGYHNPGHREAIRRVSRSQPNLLHGSYSAGRFWPYRASGSWQGRNPLAATPTTSS